MIKITVVLEEESIKEMFEDVEVKFSKAKLKELKDMLEYSELDAQEQLEETLQDFLKDMITDTWEK